MELSHSEHYNGEITFSDEHNIYFLNRAYDNFEDMVADECSIMNRILEIDFAIIEKKMCLRYKKGKPQWVTQLHLQYLK
mgnify:CR=1|tara:strand:- start:1522 stop:1758 length:237 start_codon:yes stop_codon:yes gene_type:complete